MQTLNQRGQTSATITIVILVVAVVAIGIGYAITRPSSDTDTSNTNAAMMEDTNAAVEDETMMEKTNVNAALEEDAMMEDTSNTNAAMDDGDTMEKDPEEQAAATPGTYTNYSEATYAAAANDRRVLFFHASWCPTCKAANADIVARPDEIPAGVVLLKTDYDTETALKEKYNVTYQHTFVEVDADGNALQTWNGGDIDELIAKLT